MEGRKAKNKKTHHKQSKTVTSKIDYTLDPHIADAFVDDSDAAY